MTYEITKNIKKTIEEIEAFVESETKEGTFYKVTYDIYNGWKCTCPQNRIKGNECKHITEVCNGL